HGGQESLEVEVLHGLVALADLVSRHRQTQVLHGQADTFGHDGADQDTATVVDAADIARDLLALVPVHLDQLLDHGEAAPDGGDVETETALGYSPARRIDVGLARAPHQTDHTVEGEACLLELLDGHRRRPTKEMADHPVGLEAPGDVNDLR